MEFEIYESKRKLELPRLVLNIYPSFPKDAPPHFIFDP